MTTLTKTFERKGVYHSELTRVTDPGGVVVSFTGKPKKSKDGESYYVYFKVQGEESEHYYTIENATIQAHIEHAPINVPVRLHAFGTREEATVAIEGIDGSPLMVDGQTTQSHVSAPEVPVGAPPDDLWGNEAPEKAAESPTGSAVGDTYLSCLLAARKAHAEFTRRTGSPVTPDDRAIATTLFISMNGR